MDLEAATKKRDELEDAYRAAADRLRAFPTNAMGLVLDSAKATLEYQVAKQDAQVAFSALRRFNETYTKMRRRADKAAK